METKKNRHALITSVIITIILSLSFSGWLNITSFSQNYAESLIRGYVISGQDTVKKIEYGVKYGKSLDSFYGIEELLEDVIDNNENIEELSIVEPKGNIINTTNKENIGKEVDKKIWGELESKKIKEIQSYTYIHNDSKYHVFLPIKDASSNYIGFLEITFQDKAITQRVNQYTKELIKVLIALALISGVILTLLLSKINLFNEKAEVRKKLLLTAILVILSVAQVCFVFMNYFLFNEGYTNIGENNIKLIGKIVKNDIEGIVEKGILYNELYEMEDYLNKIKEIVPEIKNIYIEDKSDKPLYDKSNLSIKDIDGNYVYKEELLKDTSGIRPELRVELSNAFIQGKMKNVLMDMITSFAVSFFFMVEIILFIFIMIERKMIFNNGKSFNNTLYEDKRIIRPLSFLVFAGSFMPTAFIPIIMKDLYRPIFDLPKDIILGLPLSVESLFGIVATIAAGYVIDKKGFKPILIIGMIIFSIGSFLSGVISSDFHFILSRSVVGIGIGLVIMSMRMFVVTTSSEIKKSEGIAAMNSGALAGVNCGVVVGAMIADRFGYSMVFFISIFVILLAQIFTMKTMKNISNSKSIKALKEKKEYNFLDFIKDIEVLKFFALILIPVSIASMFLIYFFPIYSEKIGVSTANVGRAFMLNGICVIYLGPILSKYTQKYLGVFKSLIASMVVIALSFIVFSFKDSLVIAFLVAILLGVAESFGVAAQTNYFFQIRTINKIGKGKSIGYYSLVNKIGQMIGPLIFGIAITIGMVKGVGLIGISIFILVLIFIFMNKGKGKLEGGYNE